MDSDPTTGTHTEHLLRDLLHSPIDAVRTMAARLITLAQLDEITPHDVATVMADFLIALEFLVQRALQPAAAATIPAAAAGMGARLVERAMGPSSDELVDVLSATEHALQVERGRVERVARAALSLLDELAQRGGPAHPELREWLEPLVDRQAAPGDDAQSEAP